MKEIEDQFWYKVYLSNRESNFETDAKKISDWKEQANYLYKNLMLQNNTLLKANYHWEYGSAKVYIELYENRLKDFINNNVDEDEADFVLSEFNSLKLLHLELDFLDKQSVRLDLAAYNKKKSFLKRKMEVFGIDESTKVDDNASVSAKVPTGNIDLQRDEKGKVNLNVIYAELTGFQKMMLLEKFGFFHEIPTNPTTNLINQKLAGDLLKLITGHNSHTIRKQLEYLNMSTEDIRQRSEKKAIQKEKVERLYDELYKNYEEFK